MQALQVASAGGGGVADVTRRKQEIRVGSMSILGYYYSAYPWSSPLCRLSSGSGRAAPGRSQPCPLYARCGGELPCIPAVGAQPPSSFSLPLCFYIVDDDNSR